MTDQQISTLLSDALAASDRAAFVSDWALSSMWGDAESDEIPQARVDALGRIWDTAHATVREIRDYTGLSQASFGTRYLIPKRTIENWETRGGCPDYVRFLLAERVGMMDGVSKCG